MNNKKHTVIYASSKSKKPIQINNRTDVSTNKITKKNSHKKDKKLTVIIFVLSGIAVLCLALLFFFVFGVFNSSNKQQETIETKSSNHTTVTEKITTQPQTTLEIETAETTSFESEQTTIPETGTVGDNSNQAPYERVINRTYTIPQDYISNFELELVENGQYMVKDAAVAMKKMVSDLRAAGMDIIVQSGYRSDSTQTYLNNYYTNYYGNKYEAATVSAIPYSSEHQAGLAMDLSTDGQLEQWFGDTAQGKWLAKHCAEYGFIIRYTKDKEKITGVIYEPWHFRYVGSPELAQSITASGKCMEEYFGKYLAPEDIDPYLPYLN